MVSLAQWPPLRRIGSRTRVAGLVAIGICTAACIDWITGESIVVISLYFVPLALAGARLGMRGALAAAVLASVAWLAVQHATDERFATATISGLNLITQGAAFLSVAFLFARLNESLRRERLRGRLDALTGIGNRQAFIDQASAALALCRRHRHAASVATIDLPALGSEIEDVNASADAVLRRCGQLIGWTLRESDIAGRINATRFAVFFPETSVADAAWPLERLRYVLESADDMEGLDIHMQTTIVPNGRPPAALADLLGRAERARAA